MANAKRFRSEAALARLAADWPMSRMVDIWSGLHNAKQITRFRDRQTAVSRIWKAIQNLGDPSTDLAIQHPAIVGKTAKKNRGAVGASRAGSRASPVKESKFANVIRLLTRTKGASLKELMKVTGWQGHSVRGFLSGTVRKKRALQVENFARHNGDRAYRITRRNSHDDGLE